jgi:hypothetical protein
LENPDHITLIKQHTHSKQQFVELIIPYVFCKDQLFKRIEGVKRVIVDFTAEDAQQITKEQIQTLFATLISQKYFPFMSGLKQTQVPLRHMLEFYNGKLTTEDVAETQKHGLSMKQFLETRNEGDLL